MTLSDHLPKPFKKEPAEGGGFRMHHKFVVIDFDKPTARVYLGPYNFSMAADGGPAQAGGLHSDRLKSGRIGLAKFTEQTTWFPVRLHYDTGRLEVLKDVASGSDTGSGLRTRCKSVRYTAFYRSTYRR
jgi:hypothetical protein